MEFGKNVHMGHPGLVGVPILLTVMFCFAMVLTSPETPTATSKADSTSTVSSKSPADFGTKHMPNKKHVLSKTKTTSPSKSHPKLSVSRGDGDPASTGTPQKGDANPQRAVQYQAGGTINHIGSSRHHTTKHQSEATNTSIKLLEGVVDGLLP
jgi:hypothetical protein